MKEPKRERTDYSVVGQQSYSTVYCMCTLLENNCTGVGTVVQYCYIHSLQYCTQGDSLFLTHFTPWLDTLQYTRTVHTLFFSFFCRCVIIPLIFYCDIFQERHKDSFRQIQDTVGTVLSSSIILGIPNQPIYKLTF